MTSENDIKTSTALSTTASSDANSISNNSATTSSPPYTHVEFQTSIGTFVVELYYKHAPRTCYNIAALADSGYYNGTTFHRIVRDFMIQGGDPTGTGRGGESFWGGPLDVDEITRHLKHVGAGVVSMANNAVEHPKSNGSQFFVTLQPAPFLDGKHAIFGRIAQGMSVIQRMGLVATDPNDNDRPKVPIVIHSAFAWRGGEPPTTTSQDLMAVEQ